MRNTTDTSVNDVIDKLQDALNDARNLPSWGVTAIVIIALLCTIILLHVLALFATGPCLWVLWVRRKRIQRERLLDDEIIDRDGIELTASPDTVDCDEK